MIDFDSALTPTAAERAEAVKTYDARVRAGAWAIPRKPGASAAGGMSGKMLGGFSVLGAILWIWQAEKELNDLCNYQYCGPPV